MKGLFVLVTAISVLGLAIWAYRENYATQDAQRTAEQLGREIARLRHERAMLRAEWAYLNRPDRLMELANINYDRLGLFPFDPDQFGHVDEVAFPTLLSRLAPVDLSAPGGSGEQVP